MYCLIPLAISVSHIPILSIHVTPIINLLLQFCCHLSFYNCLYFVSTLSTRKVQYLNILHVSYVHVKYNRMAYLELSCSLMLTCRSEIVKVPFIDVMLNPLKPELNSICYLLALLGAHHFLHVSRIRVKLLTLR